MRRAILTMVVGAWACGGDGSAGEGGGFEYPQPNPTPPSELRQQQPATPPTGVVHDVRMLQAPDGRFAFEPATLAIRNGDRVRWTVVNGVPHNVAFYPESVPAGAVAFLVNAVPTEGKISPLGGRILVQPGETFEMLFADAPPGSYRYFCVPHEFAGMRGTIVVRPAP